MGIGDLTAKPKEFASLRPVEDIIRKEFLD